MCQQVIISYTTFKEQISELWHLTVDPLGFCALEEALIDNAAGS